MLILSPHSSNTDTGENLGTGPCILEPLLGAGAAAWIPMPTAAPVPLAPGTSTVGQLWEVLFSFTSKIN